MIRCSKCNSEVNPLTDKQAYDIVKNAERNEARKYHADRVCWDADRKALMEAKGSIENKYIELADRYYALSVKYLEITDRYIQLRHQTLR